MREKIEIKKERSTDLAVLCSQACTLPQVLRQTYNSRLQRGAGCGRGARTVGADHARLVREESADAALVLHLRACCNGVPNRRSTGDLRIHEGVAALGFAGQGAVDQASRGQGRRRAVSR